MYILYVLYKYIEQERDQTDWLTCCYFSSHFYKNDTKIKQLNAGIVVAVGPGRPSMNGTIIPNAVKEGDKVLLPDFGGQQIKLETGPAKKEFVLYRDEEILGILD